MFTSLSVSYMYNLPDFSPVLWLTVNLFLLFFLFLTLLYSAITSVVYFNQQTSIWSQIFSLFFANSCDIFLLFWIKMMQKEEKSKKAYFNQWTGCPAMVHWSKYTTYLLACFFLYTFLLDLCLVISLSTFMLMFPSLFLLITFLSLRVSFC